MGCPICLNPEATEGLHNSLPSNREILCLRCGDFGVSRETIEDAVSINREDRWRVSAWICEYSPRVVRWEDIEQALKASVPGLLYRANRMLKALNQMFPRGGEFFSSSVYAPLTGIGWNRNEGDTRYMLEAVLHSELGFLADRTAGHYRINAKGLLHLEGVSDLNLNIGFCAMWFSDEVKPLWVDVIEPAIRAAGYEPLRIDSKEHNGKIDDQIMASIRGSRFVVADFTGSRGGVYYEAGFAHGLDLPVIFMCREGDELHFDIRQYNCIFWKTDALEDAQSRLKNRILATLGQGPLKV